MFSSQAWMNVCSHYLYKVRHYSHKARVWRHQGSQALFLLRRLVLLLASGSGEVIMGGGKEDKRKHLFFFLIPADKCLNRLLNWETGRRGGVSSTCCGTFSVWPNCSLMMEWRHCGSSLWICYLFHCKTLLILFLLEILFINWQPT